MKLSPNRTRMLRLTLALALAAAVASQIPSIYADHEAGKAMGHCKDMMKQKETMGADIKAQDAELTEQIAKMNKAPQAEKLEMMAAVLTHLVEQRSVMNARKAKMEEGMMGHMMGHMRMGKESMANCPMMKGMDDTDEKSEGGHKQPHDEAK